MGRKMVHYFFSIVEASGVTCPLFPAVNPKSKIIAHLKTENLLNPSTMAARQFFDHNSAIKPNLANFWVLLDNTGYVQHNNILCTPIAPT